MYLHHIRSLTKLFQIKIRLEPKTKVNEQLTELILSNTFI